VHREAFIDSLLSQMTLDEKLGQLNQLPGQWGDTGPEVNKGGQAEVRAGHVGSFLGVYGADYTRRLQKVAVEESRLHIPLLFGHDVIHGFRTIFPVPLAEASSWDPARVERSARIAATEASGWGLMWTFAPMVDIARDPRWGRIVEGSGEDPYLGSMMAAAKVRGFQGDDLASDSTVMATAKHFAAYGGAEGGRDYNTVDISNRTLHAIYLPPFHAAVKEDVGSVMAAFDEIGGVPMHANGPLINGVLRHDWGFHGFVVSDWTGIMELQRHGIAGTPEQAGILALKAGVDMDMVSGIYLKDLPAAVDSGLVPVQDVDRAVKRVLRAKWDLGLFRDPYRYADSTRQKARTLTPADLQAAREEARESMVLLKNDSILPLRKDLGTIAVIGSLADDSLSCLGPWHAAGEAKDAVTILQGIKRAVAPGTEVIYAKGATPVLGGTDTTGFPEAMRAVRRADAVVLVIGETQAMSGEAASRSDIDLPGVQLALAKEIQATGKPLVVVLMNGRPLATPWLAEHAPAILESWFLGVQMGPAVADVLFGDTNPSGKLPVTVPRAVGQIPIYYDHKNTGRPPNPNDHYTSKYLHLPWTPLYPFGYGLSYTTFDIGAPQLSSPTMRPGDTLTVSVDVTNTGKRAGTEVVQLYLHDEVRSVTPPVKELRGFRRVQLEPGQTKTVHFPITVNDLAFWGLGNRWIYEPGWFTVFVGSSSVDVKSARFRLVGGP
jgi:beta-glucosidase